MKQMICEESVTHTKANILKLLPYHTVTVYASKSTSPSLNQIQYIEKRIPYFVLQSAMYFYKYLPK